MTEEENNNKNHVEGEKIQGDPEVKFAYITFRNMDTVDLILDSYDDDGCCNRCCVMSFGSCFCENEKAALSKKHFFKTWPEVIRADEPDNIKWENLGVTKFSRRIRVCFTWLVAAGLILLSLIAILIMKDWASNLKENYSTNTVICPDKMEPERLKKLAWNDQQNLPEERSGLMHCYCSSISSTIIATESTTKYWADVGGE